MKSTAKTAKEYLASLPAERREALEAVRAVILKNLGNGFEERMQWGVVGYCVPHSVWPHGHHTDSKLPLMPLGFSSQKNDMVVYMLFLLHNKPEREWFDAAWKATGRKNYLEVTGAGCCLRFKKLEDLSLEVIAQAIRRTTVEKYLEDHTAMLARIGKGPDGKPIKKTAGPAAKGKKAPKPAAGKTPKKAAKKAVTKTARKPAPRKSEG